MRRLPRASKPHNETATASAERAGTAPVSVDVELDWQRILRNYSPSEMESLHSKLEEHLSLTNIEKNPRRKRGRPSIVPDKRAVLYAAAEAKIRGGKYSHIASQLGLTCKQMIDFIGNNQDEFNEILNILRDSKLNSVLIQH